MSENTRPHEELHTATSQITFAKFLSLIRRKEAFALCLLVYALALGLPAKAQPTAPPLPPKEKPHSLLSLPLGSSASAAVTRSPANSPESAAVQSTTASEIVLRNFVSPPHGAYPANGVIRDLPGNLYGTTNGAYSDIGGGGTNNSGVVFKLDACGNQRVLYSFTGGTDGSSPNGLVLDPAGNLYGIAFQGSASSNGVVFKVDPSGNETVLRSFTGGIAKTEPTPTQACLWPGRQSLWHNSV